MLFLLTIPKKTHMVVMNDDLHGMIQVNMALKKFHTCLLVQPKQLILDLLKMLGKSFKSTLPFLWVAW